MKLTGGGRYDQQLILKTYEFKWSAIFSELVHNLAGRINCMRLNARAMHAIHAQWTQYTLVAQCTHNKRNAHNTRAMHAIKFHALGCCPISNSRYYSEPIPQIYSSAITEQ